MKPNGFELYRGPSAIDGAPIVVIMTGLRGAGSANRKTGAMVQTWIMRADVDPIAALRTDADASVCGACPLRGALLPTGKRRGRACYVNVGQAPLSVWRAWKRGRYPVAWPSAARILLAGRAIRIGAYGDPGAVPESAGVWRALIEGAARHTGYTHRAADCGAYLRGQVMASTECAEEAATLRAAGWRTFRVVGDAALRAPREAQCPAAKEAGHRVTCDTCPIGCNGAGLSVVIRAHGTGARYVDA